MKIHHLEIACQCLTQRLKTFVQSFGSKLISHHAQDNSVLLQLGPIYIVLREDNNILRDTVENIAIEVDDVPQICRNVVNSCGEKYIIETNRSGSNGLLDDSVEVAIVKSPVGNVKHTLLNRNGYNGFLLPGYHPAPCSPASSDTRGDNKLIQNQTLPHELDEKCNHSNNFIGIDHVTFAVSKGTSFSYMDWYQKCFGFSRLLVNNEEKDKGFIVKTQNNYGDSLGLRLTAMEEHLCSEMGLQMQDSNPINSVKFVFAESLPGQGPNQIDSFLDAHEGPGVQHIALLTEDICNAALLWKECGVSFVTPPTHYYHEVQNILSKLPEDISALNIQKHGILVDSEGESRESLSNFLLQVFTKPIFERDTFFFELIQRHGALGFGAGNVAALWRAVDAYLREKQASRNNTSPKKNVIQG